MTELKSTPPYAHLQVLLQIGKSQSYYKSTTNNSPMVSRELTCLLQLQLVLALYVVHTISDSKTLLLVAAVV